MNIHLKMVRYFHVAFGYERDLKELTPTQVWARPSFIAEELSEFYAARAKASRVDMLDALCDLAYFALGTVDILGGLVKPLHTQGTTAATLTLLRIHYDYANGLANPDELVDGCVYVYLACKACALHGVKADFDGAFAEVHRSNMSKLDGEGKPIYNEAGKIRKSELYTPPQLEQFLR